MIGSAVYAGHWMKAAIDLAKRFAERLPGKPPVAIRPTGAIRVVQHHLARLS